MSKKVMGKSMIMEAIANKKEGFFGTNVASASIAIIT